MKLTDQRIQTQTKMAQLRYESQKKRILYYEEDAKKEHRLSVQECKACFYLSGGAALQAFTSYECNHCEKKHQYHNSRVPKYCPECAIEHHCCVRCGADIENELE